jgi:hypothetical protein
VPGGGKPWGALGFFCFCIFFLWSAPIFMESQRDQRQRERHLLYFVTCRSYRNIDVVYAARLSTRLSSFVPPPYGLELSDFGSSPLRCSFSLGDNLSHAGDHFTVPSSAYVIIPSPVSVSTVRTVPFLSDNISAEPWLDAPNSTRSAFPLVTNYHWRFLRVIREFKLSLI